MDKNNTHINDDFLKQLIKLQEDEKVPDDFTQKIMTQLPKPAVVAPQPEAKSWFNFRNAALLVVSLAVIIYLIFSFDIAGLFNLATESSSENPQNYLKMIPSVIEIFRQGFSGIKMTSISATAIIALISLYFIDRLLKRISGNNDVSAA